MTTTEQTDPTAPAGQPAPTTGERLSEALTQLQQLALSDAFDPAAPAALVSAGLHLAPVPTAAGGLGLGLRETAEILAAIAAVDGSVALGFAMHLHVVGAMAESPGWPDGLREEIYRAIRDEGALLNSAATEDGGGSPARGALPETVAVTRADGHRLTGEKTWTTWLPALRYALVTARMEHADGNADADARPTSVGAVDLGAGSAGGAPAIGTFLVDLTAPGVHRLPAFEALGMRGSASGRLRLEAVHVPLDRLIVRRAPGQLDPRGPASQGWFGLCVAATYLGVGESARRAVVRWAIDRRPGDGSTAVADLPSVAVRLGRLDAALRAARIVLLDVAGRWDAAEPGGRGRLLTDVALAKLTATNAAALATDEALRIAGGPGFLAGPLERAFRDARAGLINPPLEDVAFQGFARTLVERERAGD